jgi:rubredoxin
MEVRRRRLEWVERHNFQGWACSECAWVFNPSDPPEGDSLDDMKREFEEQRAKEFASHVCAGHRSPRGAKS